MSQQPDPSQSPQAPPARKPGKKRLWSRVFRWLVIVFVLVLSLPVLGLFWLVWFPPNLAPHIPTVSHYLMEQTGLHFHLEELIFYPGLSLILEGKNIRVSTPEQDDTVLQAEAVQLRFSPQQWLKGWPALSVVLEGPALLVRRDRDGKLYLGEHPLEWLLERRPQTQPKTSRLFLPVQHVAISQASVTWVDEGTGIPAEQRRPMRMDNVQLSLFFEPEKVVRLRLEGSLDGAGDVHLIALANREGTWSGKVTMSALTLPALSPYVGTAPPLGHFTAPITLDMVYHWYVGKERFHARWRLKTGASNLELPDLFRWPLPIKELSAQGSLLKDRTLWDIRVDRFQVHNVDGRGEGSLKLTGLGGEKAAMDLHATAKGVPTDRAKVYYPAHIMSPGLVKWLETALHGGHVESAKVRIKGPIADIPFAIPPGKKEPETLFTIEGDVRGIGLTYFPGMPDLTQAHAKVAVDRLGITIKVSQGVFGKSTGVLGHVAIADMVHDPMVAVESHIPKADLDWVWKEVVASRAVQWDKGAGLQGSRINGQGNVHLSLLLPLQDIKNTWFAGSLNFDQVRLHPPFLDTPVEQGKGRLDIDPYRITLALDSGMMNNKSMTLTTEAKQYRDAKKSSLQGRLTTSMKEEELRSWFAPLLGEEGSLQGDVGWSLDFKRQGGVEKWNISSKFQADSLDIQGGLGWRKAKGQPGVVTLEGKSDWHGDLDIATMQVELGNLSCAGGGKWQLRRGDGTIHLTRFRLDDNRGTLNISHYPKRAGEPDNWQVDGRLNHLNLAPFFTKDDPDSPGTLPVKKSETPWPKVAIGLQAAKFIMANQVQGEQLDTRITLDNKHIILHSLKGLLNNSEQFVKGELHWPVKLGSGPYRGNLHLQSKDAGLLFRGMDFQESFMHGGQGTVDVSLDGFLPPGAKLKHNLTGNAKLKLQSGTVNRLGVLSQILGLFSITELPNLVVMDRPDLTAAGYHYDQITGRVTLKRSVANLDELLLEGPSMKMVLSGSVDFPRKRLHLLLGIRPIQTLDKLVSSVPLLGTLVAGDRKALVETLFDIGGTMDEPKVTIRPVASIVPGLVRDLLITPDPPPENAEGEGKKTGRGKSQP
ncbi:MAG: AsmA-like C-terminal domain-containing protein [Magnetococcales bacterium]|nr:AsmA-like C-terminal domain-containing protein [Magnetococcales bacterium]